MKNVIDYLSGYFKGKTDGRAEILADIAKIVKDSNYPSYLEMDIIDYLHSQGVEI